MLKKLISITEIKPNIFTVDFAYMMEYHTSLKLAKTTCNQIQGYFG